MEENDLKPCPFCGGLAVAVEELGKCTVTCDWCCAELVVPEKVDQAIAAWNALEHSMCRMLQDPYYDIVRCSACGYEEERNIWVTVGEGGLVVFDGNYCPSCGARVIG